MHCEGLLFASLAAQFGTLSPAGDETSGAIKPAGQDHIAAKTAGFAGQENENGLRDFIGKLRVAHTAAERTRLR